MFQANLFFSFVVDPRASVRLLLLEFEPNTRFVDIVAQRRGKSARSSLSVRRRKIELLSSSPQTSLDALLIEPSSSSVPPPPPPPPAIPDAPAIPDVVALLEELKEQMRETMRAEFDAQVDAAVESATKDIREHYESRLLTMQEKVGALRNQVDQLERQLAQASLFGTALFGTSEIFNNAAVATNETTNEYNSEANSEANDVDDSLNFPPHKRRCRQFSTIAATAAGACQQETLSMWEIQS